MIGATNQSMYFTPSTPRRSSAEVRAIVWLALVSWLFSFAHCTAEMLESGTFASADSGLESAAPHGGSDGHRHAQQPHTDSCCTLQDTPLPAAAVTLSAPLYDRLVAVLPLLLTLSLTPFVLLRTLLQITGPPGQFRHRLLVHSISPNAPPR